MDSSSIFQNFVNGDGAPVFSTVTSPTQSQPGVYVPSSTNNANLALAAGMQIRTKVTPYRLDQANEALGDLRAGRLEGAAVLVP